MVFEVYFSIRHLSGRCRMSERRDQVGGNHKNFCSASISVYSQYKIFLKTIAFQKKNYSNSRPITLMVQDKLKPKR